MRISTDRKDIGYVQEHHKYKILVNNRQIYQVITADEDKGYVFVNKTHDNHIKNASIILNATGRGPLTMMLYGQVKIIKLLP